MIAQLRSPWAQCRLEPHVLPGPGTCQRRWRCSSWCHPARTHALAAEAIWEGEGAGSPCWGRVASGVPQVGWSKGRYASNAALTHDRQCAKLVASSLADACKLHACRRIEMATQQTMAPASRTKKSPNTGGSRHEQLQTAGALPKSRSSFCLATCCDRGHEPSKMGHCPKHCRRTPSLAASPPSIAWQQHTQHTHS